MRLTVLALIGLLIVPATVPARSQVKAYAPGISGDRVVLQLYLNSRPARVVVQNGTMARVKTGGLALGLVPSATQDKVNLTIVQIFTDAAGNEGVRQVDRLQLERGGVSRHQEGNLVLDVQWVETLPPIQQTVDGGGCWSCCVTCGDDTICACRVEMECGHCCCQSHCLCEWNDGAIIKSPQPGTSGQACTSAQSKPGAKSSR